MPIFPAICALVRPGNCLARVFSAMTSRASNCSWTPDVVPPLGWIGTTRKLALKFMPANHLSTVSPYLSSTASMSVRACLLPPVLAWSSAAVIAFFCSASESGFVPVAARDGRTVAGSTAATGGVDGSGPAVVGAAGTLAGATGPAWAAAGAVVGGAAVGAVVGAATVGPAAVEDAGPLDAWAMAGRA